MTKLSSGPKPQAAIFIQNKAPLSKMRLVMPPGFRTLTKLPRCSTISLSFTTKTLTLQQKTSLNF
jgi:hypothetical protein